MYEKKNKQYQTEHKKNIYYVKATSVNERHNLFLENCKQRMQCVTVITSRVSNSDVITKSDKSQGVNLTKENKELSIINQIRKIYNDSYNLSFLSIYILVIFGNLCIITWTKSSLH